MFPHKQGEASPLPQAINVVQPGLRHPADLLSHLGEAVRRIVCGATDPGKELVMTPLATGGNYLQVRKDTTGIELTCDLFKQRPFTSTVLQVMDGES